LQPERRDRGADPFDIDVPKRIVVSNSGRYRLHVFEGRYRVFDLSTGAKLVDRPATAPTSRPRRASLPPTSATSTGAIWR
jgi:hypothetical protein